MSGFQQEDRFWCCQTRLLNSAFSSYQYYRNSKHQICSVVKGIIKNHPFRDGNKRTALFFLYVVAEEYRFRLIPDDVIDDKLVDIAANEYSVEEISNMLFV